MRIPATDLRITKTYLKDKKSRAIEMGFQPAKWILFCESMLDRGYKITLYEARRTVSKYITVKKGRMFKRIVRFSNHKPKWEREKAQDSDIWVGARHQGKWITWEDAIQMIEEQYERSK